MNKSASISSSEILIATSQHIGYGQQRSTLEDRCHVEAIPTSSGLQLTVGIVADGVGGSNAGERASQLVLDICLSYIKASQEADIFKIIEHALQQAHLAIRSEAKSNPSLNLMATTATLAVIHERQLYLAHVGDSRAYLVRGDKIRLLTLDHTWGVEMIREGKFTLDEVASHSKRNALGRYLGQPVPLMIDLGVRLFDSTGQTHVAKSKLIEEPLVLEPGDILVLCTDGLIKENRTGSGHFVEENEIIQVVRHNQTKDAANTLLSYALGRKVDDNVSVVLMEVPGGKRPLSIPGFRSTGTPVWLFAVGGIVILMLLAGFGFLLSGGRSLESTPTSEVTADATVTATSVPLPSQAAATVLDYLGAASFQTQGQENFLSKGLSLPAGQDVRLYTQTGSSARLKLIDGSILHLGSDSAIYLVSVKGVDGQVQTEVKLERGMLLVIGQELIVRAEQREFEAAAINGLMGVLFIPSQGVFQVDCLDGRCRVGSTAISGGERRGYESGLDAPALKDPPAEADYESWLELDKENVPTPTASPTPLPTVTPTETPTATPRPPIGPGTTAAPAATGTPAPSDCIPGVNCP